MTSIYEEGQSQRIIETIHIADLTYMTYTLVLRVEHTSTTSFPHLAQSRDKLPADPRSVPTSALQSPQTFSKWSVVFLSSVSLVGSILEHGVPHWTLVFAWCGRANPTFVSLKHLLVKICTLCVKAFVMRQVSHA